MKKIFLCLSLVGLSFSLCACGKKTDIDQVSQTLTSSGEVDAELSRDPSEVINDARAVASYFYFDNHDANYYDESIEISASDNKAGAHVSSQETSENNSEVSVSPAPETSVTSEIDEENVENEDSRKWCKVVDVRFNTTEAAKKFLRTQFSDSLADKILSQAIKEEIFKEVDGNLFALVGDGGRLVDSTEYTVKSQTNNKIVYSVIVKYLADEDDADGNPQYETKEYNFVREKINGEWVFTKFEYVW